MATIKFDDLKILGKAINNAREILQNHIDSVPKTVTIKFLWFKEYEVDNTDRKDSGYLLSKLSLEDDIDALLTMNNMLKYAGEIMLTMEEFNLIDTYCEIKA